MSFNLSRYLIIICICSAVNGQSDSARYLWNTGDYRYGDKFFRCDAPDTLFIGARQIFAISDAESTIIIPRKSLSVYGDSGGIIIYPIFSTIQWNFPKAYESNPTNYACATIGIAPDEFQIAMEGTSLDNRDICLYSRRNLTFGLSSPDDQGGDYKIQIREIFNSGLPSIFERFPFRVWSDRPGYGYGLTKFMDLSPSYANMGYYNDSVIVINIQIDTLFGAYGELGSGYGKFIRGQILDTMKFDIDVTGAYTIHDGTEIRPKAVQTDSLHAKFIVATDERFAGTLYVNRTGKFRIAKYISGITPDCGCILTLQGDNDDFVMLKGLCKTDSLIIRGSADYTGYIEYLLYKKAYRKKCFEEYEQATPAGFLNLEVLPSIANRTTQLRYMISERQHVRLALYDIVGREAVRIVEGVVDPGTYSYDFDLSALSQGIYFLRLEAGKEIRNEKVVIVK